MRALLLTITLLLAGCGATTHQDPLQDRRLWGDLPSDQVFLVYAAGAGYVHLTPTEITVQITGDPIPFTVQVLDTFKLDPARIIPRPDSTFRIFYER